MVVPLKISAAFSPLLLSSQSIPHKEAEQYYLSQVIQRKEGNSIQLFTCLMIALPENTSALPISTMVLKQYKNATSSHNLFRVKITGKIANVS